MVPPASVFRGRSGPVSDAERAGGGGRPRRSRDGGTRCPARGRRPFVHPPQQGAARASKVGGSWDGSGGAPPWRLTRPGGGRSRNGPGGVASTATSWRSRLLCLCRWTTCSHFSMAAKTILRTLPSPAVSATATRAPTSPPSTGRRGSPCCSFTRAIIGGWSTSAWPAERSPASPRGGEPRWSCCGSICPTGWNGESSSSEREEIRVSARSSLDAPGRGNVVASPSCRGVQGRASFALLAKTLRRGAEVSATPHAALVQRHVKISG